MSKILILFAHPALEKSRVHRSLNQVIKNLEGITFNDLYEAYPDFNIDITKEQQLLLQHDIIVFQHPFYWYSAPAIMKQWQDLVLEHGWAYGRKGKALLGKKTFNALSSGGGMHSYQQSGYQKATVQELLLPFHRTATLCSMTYLPPYWVPGSHLLTEHQIEQFSQDYRTLLIRLRDGDFQDEELTGAHYLNQLITTPKIER